MLGVSVGAGACGEANGRVAGGGTSGARARSSIVWYWSVLGRPDLFSNDIGADAGDGGYWASVLCAGGEGSRESEDEMTKLGNPWRTAAAAQRRGERNLVGTSKGGRRAARVNPCAGSSVPPACRTTPVLALVHPGGFATAAFLPPGHASVGRGRASALEYFCKILGPFRHGTEPGRRTAQRFTAECHVLGSEGEIAATTRHESSPVFPSQEALM